MKSPETKAININAGVCPTCNERTHFMPTFKKHVFRCEICLNKVKQQMNGKIIYKEIPIPQILLDL